MYRDLRRFSLVLFGVFLNFEDVYILLNFLERFIRCVNKRIEIRLIKGICLRGKDKEEDLRF